MSRLRRTIVTSLLSLGLVTFYGVPAAQAGTGTSVSSVSFSTDSFTASELADWTVQFTTSSAGSLTQGAGTITLNFPTSTSLPTSALDYSVIVNNQPDTVQLPPQVSGSSVTLVVPEAIAASTAVQVSVNNAHNPGAATYPDSAFTVSTSSDTTPGVDTATVGQFTAPVAASPTPTGVNLSLSEGAYGMVTVTGSVYGSGNTPVPGATVLLSANEGQLSPQAAVTGPDGSFTSSLSASVSGNITVTASVYGTNPQVTATQSINIIDLGTAPASVVLSAPTSVPEGTTATVTGWVYDASSHVITSAPVIDMTSNVGQFSSIVYNGDGSFTTQFTAPSTVTTANVQATVQGTSISQSASMNVVAPMPVTQVSVTPDSMLGGVKSSWNIHFTTSANGALVANQGTVTLTFPSGTTLPSSGLNYLVGDASSQTSVSTQPTVNGNQVTFTVPSSFAASSTVYVTVSGVTNPTAGTYASSAFQVRTSCDTAASPSSSLVFQAPTSGSNSDVIHLSLNPTSVLGGYQTTVSGSVYDSGGQPVSGVTVQLTSPDGSISPTSVDTDGTGAFTATMNAGNGGPTETVTATVYGTSATASATLNVTPVNPYPSGEQISGATLLLNGQPAPSGFELWAANASGVLQIEIQYNGRDELSGGLSGTNNVFEVQLPTSSLNGFQPGIALATGHIDSYNPSDTVNGRTVIDLQVTPGSASWLYTPPASGPWPTQADVDFNKMLLLAVQGASSLGDASVEADMNGAYIATNAQEFGIPTYDSATGSIQFQVTAPHLTAAGQQNTGEFEAFIPVAVLTHEWGVSDPSKLAKRNSRCPDSYTTTVLRVCIRRAAHSESAWHQEQLASEHVATWHRVI